MKVSVFFLFFIFQISQFSYAGTNSNETAANLTYLLHHQQISDWGDCTPVCSPTEIQQMLISHVSNELIQVLDKNTFQSATVEALAKYIVSSRILFKDSRTFELLFASLQLHAAKIEKIGINGLSFCEKLDSAAGQLTVDLATREQKFQAYSIRINELINSPESVKIATSAGSTAARWKLKVLESPYTPSLLTLIMSL